MQECWSYGEDRQHTVYRYTDQIYKVIQFYRPRSGFVVNAGEHEKHDKKLDSSISRSKRVVLELALCNPWDYFCTFTISGSEFDRTDLAGWRDTFTQWLRDKRKKYPELKYLLVPEKHEKKDSWHAHGFMYGLPSECFISFKQMDAKGYRTPSGKRLPKKLRESDYLNWPDYMNKFGFCSFGRIDNPVAAGFYVTKYMTKDNDRLVQDVGLHSYYCSRGLNRAEKFLDFFGRSQFIDDLLVNKYDFCATGMTHLDDHLDWTFGSEFITNLEPLDVSDQGSSEAEKYIAFEQMMLGVI